MLINICCSYVLIFFGEKSALKREKKAKEKEQLEQEKKVYLLFCVFRLCSVISDD